MATTSVPLPDAVVLYTSAHHAIDTPLVHDADGHTQTVSVTARFDADPDQAIADLTERDNLKGALAACVRHRAPLWVPDPRALLSGDDARAVQGFLTWNGLYLILGAHPLDWAAPSDQVEAATRQAIDRHLQLRVAVTTSHPWVSDAIADLEAQLRHPDASVDTHEDPATLQAEYDEFAAQLTERDSGDLGDVMDIWHLAVLATQCQLGQRAPQLVTRDAPWADQERSHARLATWILTHLHGCHQETVATYLTYRGARTVRGKPYTQSLVSRLKTKHSYERAAA